MESKWINNNIQLNWIFILIPIIMFPNLYWLIPSRIMIIFKLLIDYLFNEFKIIIINKYISNVYIFLRIIIYIIVLHLFRLVPYIFTSTGHLLFNLSTAFSIRLRFIIYTAINFPIKILRHLVPLNSPKFLINFIVIIEIIRDLLFVFKLYLFVYQQI